MHAGNTHVKNIQLLVRKMWNWTLTTPMFVIIHCMIFLAIFQILFSNVIKISKFRNDVILHIFLWSNKIFVIYGFKQKILLDNVSSAEISCSVLFFFYFYYYIMLRAVFGFVTILWTLYRLPIFHWYRSLKICFHNLW